MQLFTFTQNSMKSKMYPIVLYMLLKVEERLFLYGYLCLLHVSVIFSYCNLRKENLILFSHVLKLFLILKCWKLITVKAMARTRKLQVEKYRYSRSMLIDDWRSDVEIKTRIALPKQVFNEKESLFCSSIGL